MDGIGQAMQVNSKLRSRRPFLKERKELARVEKVEMQLDVIVDLEEFTHSLEVQSYDNLNRVVHYLLVN